ncbi:MAG: hypothetical protein WKF84_22415 [Pyrinomonadaceae bacterium]
MQPPERFLVIEPDEELRRILVAEIEEATNFKTTGVSPAGLRLPILQCYSGSAAVAMSRPGGSRQRSASARYLAARASHAFHFRIAAGAPPRLIP